jgi:hypothetical protein
VIDFDFMRDTLEMCPPMTRDEIVAGVADKPPRSLAPGARLLIASLRRVNVIQARLDLYLGVYSEALARRVRAVHGGNARDGIVDGFRVTIRGEPGREIVEVDPAMEASP